MSVRCSRQRWLSVVAAILVLLPAGAWANATTRSDRVAVRIDFDDDPAGCDFASTGPLREKYNDLGVHFRGLGGDGGAILDKCSSFNVIGYSKPNFLAFNVGAVMANGGIPQPPEKILFATPVSLVQMNVGSRVYEPLVVQAYDAAGRLIASATVVLTNQVQLVSVDATGIASVSVNTTSSNWVLDDLAAR
jgi:hypothetical protein